MRHIIPLSGKDSLATAIVQMNREPNLPYEFVFNETGAETPEVNEWLNRVEDKIGIEIVRVGANLEERIDHYGILPSARVRFCTREVKIHPFEDYIGKDKAFAYYGIRADEKRVGYDNSKRLNITPVYPLVEMGIGISGVWDLVLSTDCPPPTFFWQSMYDLVRDGLGEYAPVLDTLDRQTHIRLFAGRSRANCFFCFFQRTYEWVWLLETHPTLFERACEIEATTGADGYNWRSDGSLHRIEARKDLIKQKRAKQIIKHLLPQQTLLWQDDTAEEEPIDLLSVVSCGLFCGK